MSESAQASAFSSQLVEKADDAVIIASNDGTILVWNPGAARVFGWSAEQALGENIDMLIPEGDKDKHWEGYDRVLESGETKFSGGELLRVAGLRADGSRVPVEMSITPLTEDGSVAAIGVIVRPVRRGGAA